LVVSPGMEPHIRPMEVSRHHQTINPSFLHTSPEFAMKKVLAEGFSKIYQICKVYRDEPKSATHHPEFTMIEWYRANSNYTALMDDTEELIRSLCAAVYGPSGFRENVSDPFLRISVNEAFQRFVGLPLTEVLSLNLMKELCQKKNLIS